MAEALREACANGNIKGVEFYISQGKIELPQINHKVLMSMDRIESMASLPCIGLIQGKYS